MASRRPIYLNSAYGGVSEFKDSDPLLAGQFVASGVNGVGFDAGGQRLINLPDPQSATDPATKAYADNLAQGVTLLPAVRVLANSNQTLSGLPTVDGVQLVAGDTVLLTAQQNPVTNGKWKVTASGPWVRPDGSTGVSDYTTGRVASSLAMFVREGTVFAEQGWIVVTDGNPKVDADAVQFTQFTALGEVIAGAGLQKGSASGNAISLLLAGGSGLQISGGALDTLIDTAGGLKKSASGLGVLLNSNATIASDAQDLRAMGVPSLWTIGGTATTANVSAPNLNTLTGGTGSIADSLHQHTNVLQARASAEVLNNGTAALAAGDPVYWSGSADTLGRSDASDAKAYMAFGVAAAPIAASSSGTIVRRGIAAGVLNQATPGTAYYLASGGGLTTTPPSGNGVSQVRIGFSKNSTDLDVNPAVLIVRQA